MSDCPACSAVTADGQRYCVACGSRLGGASPAADAGAPSALPPRSAAARRATPAWTIRSPTPRAAAALALGFLGLGSVVGAAAQPGRSLAGRPPVVLTAPTPAAVAPAPPPTLATAIDAAPTSAPTAEPDGDAGLTPAASEEPGVDTAPETAPTDDADADTDADADAPTDAGMDTAPAEDPAAPTVRHVWLVVLAQTSFDAAYGPDSQLPALAVDGASKGTLLTQVHAVAHGSLPGGIALVSGQGPNPSLVRDCPDYTDLSPGRVDENGLAEGDGCVFPAQVSTLFDQFRANGLGWKVYAQDSERGAAAAPATGGCRHPVLGQPDPWQAPRPGDAYLTARNPAVYFHSVIDVPDCESSVVGLDALVADLRRPATRVPAFSYVVPNACLDGRATPCAAGRPSGPAATEPALAHLLRQIKHSPAYEDGGLIIVTSDQGATDDLAGCCRSSADGATTDRQPAGGGRVGALLLSDAVRRGHVDDTPLDQFSLLRLVEDLFGLSPLGHAADAPVVPQEIFLPE